MKHLRKDFPFLSKKNPPIYFDSAATAQKPFCVIDAISSFYSYEYGTVHRGIYQQSQLATKRYDETREAVRKFINANSSNEIIFTRGTTDSINLVCFSYAKTFLQKGDEIILSQTEHHSNIVPWQMLVKEKEIVIKVIPVSDKAELILEEYKKLLTSKTKLVSIAHMANATGVIHPIKKIIALAHEKGAKVLIDGAQGIAHLVVDVQELDADFYAFSGHKMYGPTGIGILYGKKELLDLMPPIQGGGDMIEKVSFAKTTYAKPPLRFEAGTPMIAEVIGLKSAIDFIEKIGKDNIASYEKELLIYATDKLKQIPGLKIIGDAPEKGAVISFIIEGMHPLDIGTLLDLKNIAIRTGHHCAQPTMQRFQISSTARVSFGIYNTIEEIDYFIEALLNILSTLIKVKL